MAQLLVISWNERIDLHMQTDVGAWVVRCLKNVNGRRSWIRNLQVSHLCLVIGLVLGSLRVDIHLRLTRMCAWARKSPLRRQPLRAKWLAVAVLERVQTTKLRLVALSRLLLHPLRWISAGRHHWTLTSPQYSDLYHHHWKCWIVIRLTWNNSDLKVWFLLDISVTDSRPRSGHTTLIIFNVPV